MTDFIGLMFSFVVLELLTIWAIIWVDEKMLPNWRKNLVLLGLFSLLFVIIPLLTIPNPTTDGS